MVVSVLCRILPSGRQSLALSAALVLSGCATDWPWQKADQELQADILRLEHKLKAWDAANYALLLNQGEEFKDYHQDLSARLDHIGKQLTNKRHDGQAESARAVSCPPPPEPHQKLVLGRVEKVVVRGIDAELKARVDTGAGTSSLHADQIIDFERDGKRWVRFETRGEDDELLQLEAPVAHYIRIRQASSEKLERRPVVELPVRLGRIEELTELSLTDREDMLYPVLLGRSFFMDIAVVDAGRKFVETKHAPEPETRKAQQ